MSRGRGSLGSDARLIILVLHPFLKISATYIITCTFDTLRTFLGCEFALQTCNRQDLKTGIKVSVAYVERQEMMLSHDASVGRLVSAHLATRVRDRTKRQTRSIY